MEQERLSLLALHYLPGVGDYLVRQLVSYSAGAAQVFKTPPGKLLRIPGVGRKTADAIARGQPFKAAEEALLKAGKQNVEIVLFTDRSYPKRLRGLADAPVVLFMKGQIQLDVPRVVAIVGTRNATTYGKRCVEELVACLKPHRALIVSGLAYGIDIMAHRQSLSAGLATVGVMGSGIDVIYPAVHTETARRMQENGGLVTEETFGAKPDAHNFPSRNRIIAGLCDALVVVEAAARGGALITAEIANSYNKDVFAFPGSVGESFSEGCNNLIKTNKAHLLTGIADLEYIMNWSAGMEGPAPEKEYQQEDFSEEEYHLLMMLKEKNRNIQLDELSWISGLPVSKAATILLSLEFKGVIQSLPGKMYALKRPS